MIPTLLVGDFNTPIDSNYVGLLNKKLTHAFDDVGQGYIATWPQVKNPALNHGWILIGDEANSENARRLASRECPASQICTGEVPQLTVTYSVPSVVDHLISRSSNLFSRSR